MVCLLYYCYIGGESSIKAGWEDSLHSMNICRLGARSVMDLIVVLAVGVRCRRRSRRCCCCCCCCCWCCCCCCFLGRFGIDSGGPKIGLMLDPPFRAKIATKNKLRLSILWRVRTSLAWAPRTPTRIKNRVVCCFLIVLLVQSFSLALSFRSFHSDSVSRHHERQSQSGKNEKKERERERSSVPVTQWESSALLCF